jgi:hypothetical protein
MLDDERNSHLLHRNDLERVVVMVESVRLWVITCPILL